MSPGVIINYHDDAGRLATAGEIKRPDLSPEGPSDIRFHGVQVKIRKRHGQIVSMLAPDRTSAETLVAALRLK